MRADISVRRLINRLLHRAKTSNYLWVFDVLVVICLNEWDGSSRILFEYAQDWLTWLDLVHREVCRVVIELIHRSLQITLCLCICRVNLPLWLKLLETNNLVRCLELWTVVSLTRSLVLYLLMVMSNQVLDCLHCHLPRHFEHLQNFGDMVTSQVWIE